MRRQRIRRLGLWGAVMLLLSVLVCVALSGCTDAPGTSDYVSLLTTRESTSRTTLFRDVDGAGWVEGFY